jgi:DNA-binding SARP family transcriptional activator/pimeloyl-ACP methyl ester carboxylesterase
VRILVLGPVQVLGADGAVQPLERRARELLTLLALRAPEAVAADDLVDLLWDAPPPSATKSLQSHLSRVRSALARAGFGADALSRSASGAYRLDVGTGATDVDEFVDRRSRGRDLLRSGRTDDAAAMLRRARACWRGPLEVPETTAAAAVEARWQQERRRAEEEHLAAIVDGGRPDDAVPELSAAVAADPLDERLAELLVVALHRSGRQLEAVRAYQSARGALADVGLEPGPALRAAEAGLYLGDAARPAARPEAPVSRTPVPVQFAHADGVSIAFAVRGDGPRDLVLLSPAFVSIDALDGEPHLAAAVDRLSGWARVVCFDRRGIGLSDRTGVVDGDPIDTWVDDLEAVLDAARMDRPLLLANADTCLVALAFAAARPGRLRGLALVHGYARYTRADDYPFGIDQETARHASEDSRAPQPPAGAFDPLSAIAPSVAGDDGFRRWWDETGRRAAGPATAAFLHDVVLNSDVRDRLRDVQAPVLLLHRRSCASCDVGHARYLHDHLPRARLEMVAGADDLWFVGDVTTLLDRVETFDRTLP